MVWGVHIPIDEISDLKSQNSDTWKNQVQGNLWKEMATETEKLSSMGVTEKSVHQRDKSISPVVMV